MPLQKEVDVLGLELNKIRLLIKSRKRGALLWFNNKLEEPMFIKLESIEPTPKPDSLLGLAQKEERAENIISNIKEVPKEITREEDAGGGYYNAAKDKDPNDPFISDHPFS
jgi:hypothetical protein